MVVFSERMLPEVMDVFWGALARGETVTDAAKEVGTYREKGGRWIAACSGIRPRRARHLKGRCLTFAEREEIVLLRATGHSMLAVNLELRAIVEQGLARKYSPAQIAARLRMRFPTSPEMWVSAETIYQCCMSPLEARSSAS
jgi:transposase, IS30 family